ncbi:uncharacterized protein [Henckelia pumila]|uniref:uncharacterized protein n=1 Tax=Henckelia pumila TaxID=405737 RepID=UPI003C6E9F9C
MESSATSASFMVKSKKGEKSRRSWTAREEEVLIHSLKDVIAKGWKSENGFKVGYLNLLECALKEALPGCDLRGNPHVNSKWYCWNDSEKTIEATDETWEALIKGDASVRSMRHKQWTHYNDWCEIFGNDRAAGETTNNFRDVLQDVLRLDSDTPTNFLNCETPTCPPVHPLRQKKRKKLDELDDSFVGAINNLAQITKSTIADLVKNLAPEDKVSDAQDVVLEVVQQISELSADEQVRAARLLFHNHDDLVLFKRLGEEGRKSLIRRLLDGN